MRLNRGSTHFLRFAVGVLGTGVLALCVFALPAMWQGAGSPEFPQLTQVVRLIVIGFYASAVPFYIALWQTFKLLRYIDHNQAFSEGSVNALRTIKYCATIIALLYVAGVPLLFPIADADDAPGLILIGAAFACAPLAIAVFAAVLERLLRSAMSFQEENELTV